MRSFIDTTNTGNKQWGPSLVDEELDAICQPMFQGVEGTEWGAMYCRYKDSDQAVESQKSGEHKKAKVLSALKKAEDSGVDFYDASHGKDINTRSRAR